MSLKKNESKRVKQTLMTGVNIKYQLLLGVEGRGGARTANEERRKTALSEFYLGKL